jgi:hypothetical protein
MKFSLATTDALLLSLALALSDCAKPSGDPTVREASTIAPPTPTPDARDIPFGFRGGRQGH